MKLKKMPPPLFPCEKNGNHEVEDIHRIDPGQSETFSVFGDNATLVKQFGYKWRGTCKICGMKIVAKDRKEYELNG